MTNTANSDSTQSQIRALSDHEKFFYMGQVTVLYAISGQGSIDENALYTAIRAWETEYPLLERVITSSPGPIEFLPEIHLVNSPEISEQGPLFQRYTHSFQPDRYPILETLISTQRLFAVELYQPTPEEYTLVVYIRHIISDAKNGIALLHKLWKLYTKQITQGKILARKPLEIPADNETIVIQRNHSQQPPIKLADLIHIPSLHTGPNITGTPQLLNPPVRLHLTEEFSTQLKNAGKSQGLTINSLISAALIMAEFDLLTHEKRDNTELLLNTEVDLRPHGTPRIGELEITNFLGNSFYTAHKNPLKTDSETSLRTATFLRYAQEIKEKIQEDLDDKQVYSLSRFTPELIELVITMIEEWKTPLSHTNWGIVTEFAAPPEITHTDFRGWNLIAPNTNLEDPIGLLSALLYNAMVFTSTFHNRISIDIVQAGPFFPPHAAEFIAQAMHQILHAWVDHTL